MPAPTTLQPTITDPGTYAFQTQAQKAGTQPVPITPPVASPAPPITPPTTTPTEPTVISSDKEQTIASNQQALQNASQRGITIDANGIARYANNTIAQTEATSPTGQQGTYLTNPTTGIEEFVKEGTQPSWETPGGKSQRGVPFIQGTTVEDPLQTPEYLQQQQTYTNMLSQADALSATAIQNIQKQYEDLMNQQKQINAGAEAGRMQSLLLGGARYEQLQSTGIMQQELSYGQSKLADLLNKESQAITAAQQAAQKGDMELVDKQVALYNDANKQKQDLLNKQQDIMFQQKQKLDDIQQQANKDSAIQQVMASGITDPTQILSTLQSQGYKNITSKDVADTINNLRPDQKAITDLLKVAGDSGAPKDVLQKIAQSTNINDAYIAASGYLTKPSGLIAEYQFAKSPAGGGYTGSYTDFIQAYNQAKSAGTTAGKSAGAGGAEAIITPNTLADAIALQESGGSYTAQNPDSGALGKYQIMPEHLADIGLTTSKEDQQKFLNSPDLQEQLYTKLYTDLQTKYAGNTDKILAAWYGGDGAAQIVGTSAADKPQGKYPSINEYVAQAKSRLMWSTNDATPPPTGASANMPYGITGRTPNDIWQNAINLALDKTFKVQQALGGLSGSSGAGMALKNAISNKAAALLTKAGVDQPILQAQWAANSKSLGKQVDFLNTTDRALNAAENGAKAAQNMFATAGVNPMDSTWANKTLNDFIKQFGDSTDVRAYQSTLKEVANEFDLVFSRGGVRSVEGRQQANDIVNGNVKMGDLQKTFQSLEEIGNINVQASIDQISKVSNAGYGADQVAKFLSVVHQRPDSATQQVVQNNKASQDKINSWASQSKENSDLVQQLLKIAPDMNPDEIISKLKIQ